MSCTRSEYFLSGTCRRAEGETYIYYPLVYNSKCKFKEEKNGPKKKKKTMSNSMSESQSINGTPINNHNIKLKFIKI